MLSAAGSMAWLRGLLDAPFGELDAEAAAWPAGTEGLLFAPYLAGERTPHADPDARGAFTGLSLRHDRGALARAVMEGVAYGLRDSLELLRELGVRARRSAASPAAARAASCGRGSSPRCSTCRSSAPRPTPARRSERRCSPACARASSPTPPRRSTRCVRVASRVEPEPEWVEAYARRLRALPRAVSRTATAGGRHESRRQDGSDHRREPRHRRRRRAVAPPAGREARPRVAQRRRPRPRQRRRAAVRRPRPGAARRRCATRRPSGSAASTSSSRTRASARTARSSTSRRSTSTR